MNSSKEQSCHSVERNTFVKSSRLSTLARGVSHGRILIALAITAILIVVAVITTSDDKMADGAILVYVGFLINGALSVTALLIEISRGAFSLAQMHWLFYLTFFVIAPMSQYAHGYNCWGYPLSSDNYSTANAFLFLWGSLFLIATQRRKPFVDSSYSGFYARLPMIRKSGLVASMAISLACTIVLVRLVGLDNLFSRDTFSLGLDNSSIALLAESALRGIPYFTFLFCLARFKNNRDCAWLLVLDLVFLLIAVFPMGLPRYYAAVIYGPILVLTIPSLLCRKGVFAIVFLAALLVVFPAINVFRNESFNINTLVMALGDSLINLPEGFLTGDYDAYSMLARTLDYVSSQGISFGYDFLAALLFFVPRALWPEKSVGSGHEVATQQGQAYTNLSCPLPAEGYINFGLVGLCFFAVAIGLICRFCDLRYSQGNQGVWKLFYPSGCFFLFFVMRGDLLSSGAYFSGYLVIFIIISRLIVGKGALKKT